MKLKKIASLALAGIMAVSMLAGCKDGGNSNSGSSSENTSTASGYSKVLADNLSDDVTDKKYVTFQDNAQDEAALRQSLNNLNTEALRNNSAGQVLECIDGWNQNGFAEMLNDFADAVKFTDGVDIKEPDLSMAWYSTDAYVNRTVKDGTVYVIDGAVGANEAVKQVADKIEQYLKQLPEDNTANLSNTSSNFDVYDYEYTVSVSVVNKAVNAVNWSNASVTFIAVTVTRTATAD